MREVVVLGVGMTPFGKFPESTVSGLAETATATALRDAGIGPDLVGYVFFSNAVGGLLQGQEMIRGQAALRSTGLLGLPIINVENACASASTAVHLAWLSVAAGQCDVAIAVGAEKLTHPVKGTAGEAIASAVDLELIGELKRGLYERDGAPGAGGLFMDVYGRMGASYMERTDATVGDFAAVAVKSRANAALNPVAQFRQPITVDEVLASRQISGPLTLPMCSPIGDGAAAVVVCSAEFARSGGFNADVRVRASVLISGRRSAPSQPAVSRAAAAAYEQSRIVPGDLDVIELHDAAAPAELIISEELGLCPEGGGAKLLRSGETGIDGKLPINPSGGLLSRGHPIGATGCAQIVELTQQLRGNCGSRQVGGAAVGLAENGGGYLGPDPAAACVTILSRT